MSTNAWDEINRTEKRPIGECRATNPDAAGSIATFMDQVMGLSEETECLAGKELAIETALREALANAIVHGCKNDKR